MKRRARHQHGFSLVEILVAFSILAVTVSALAQSQVMHLRTTVRSERLTTAKAQAGAYIERLAAHVLYVDTSVSPPRYRFSEYTATCTPGNAHEACRGTHGNLAWEVTTEPGYLGEGLLLLRVTASNADGKPFVLVQRVTCYDIYPAPTKDTPAPCPAIAGAPGGSQ